MYEPTQLAQPSAREKQSIQVTSLLHYTFLHPESIGRVSVLYEAATRSSLPNRGRPQTHITEYSKLWLRLDPEIVFSQKAELVAVLRESKEGANHVRTFILQVM